MHPRSVLLLRDARGALQTASFFIADCGLDSFRANDLLRSAVERKLSIAGEALSVLRRTDAELAATVPYLDRAVGLRNIIIHDYASIDPEIIWQVATYHSPSLSAALGATLDQY